jgi:hypothetical protein
VTTAQIAKAVTEAATPPVKFAVTTAEADHPVAVGWDVRSVIRVAFAPVVGVTETPPPSGTFPVGQLTETGTFVPLFGLLAVVKVA